MRDSYAHRHTGGLMAQHAAGAGAVPVQAMALAPEQRGRAIGLTVDYVGHMRQGGRVQNGVNRGMVVGSALMQTFDAIDCIDRVGGSFCWHSFS